MCICSLIYFISVSNIEIEKNLTIIQTLVYEIKNKFTLEEMINFFYYVLSTNLMFFSPYLMILIFLIKGIHNQIKYSSFIDNFNTTKLIDKFEFNASNLINLIFDKDIDEKKPFIMDERC